MPTSEILDALPGHQVIGTLPAAVTGIADDSRRVAPGDCFVAVPGFRQDARRFVADAVARGAALVVTEGEPLADVAVAQVLVPSARAAVGRLAAAYHRHPSRDLTLVGITGTNGKTTTSYLVDALLQAVGLRTGVIGTIQYVIGDERRPAGQTTPDALEIQSMLARMREQGIRGVAMEVSSHALVQSRVDDLTFDVAVFTNLTQDHLDFHGTLAAYRAAKRRLFELLEASPKPRRTAVVNADDPAGADMVRGLRVPTLTFGLGAGAVIHAVEHTSTMQGIRLVAETPPGRLTLTSPLIGEHNVMNLLGAVGVGVALGLAPEAIARGLGRVATVPGRFEQVHAGQPFLVLVDYAHTPDALERVLATARKITGGRLAVVFGCGGDRDRGKRPIMGEIAARLADRVWVTSDNPRSERPGAIVDEIVAGVRRVAGDPARIVAEPDRRAAIAGALAWAGRGDTVVIAGKGHEPYQIIGADVLTFDDRDVARDILMHREAESP
ncbi:MAG: UDP-N-acetylmuramoyl-L-alanyl-D-glutamate--2,6-diaminopimelate ligase [Candidatus Rokubacteria bacterium]|nr:UDP-N-acetylmuramoyl-L-alanyl-D-glutamate--2,6-diaminopimelate ligase [Candidatus Rokubacteria bacterium]MBI3825738.1 UDP-N-acetylmuramoyl-L-alanyl-D-glutamate--2,6-diaminopimelate ligase [Candidatus Rokubacteria bacterium]